MTQPGIDLHIHTTCSDGVTTPEDIARSAIRAGLRAIAITDHDAADGIDRALRANEEAGGDLEVVPGIELSASAGNDDVHILGYFMDHHHEALLEALGRFREARYRRAQKMVARLNVLGLDLKFDTVLGVAGNAALGRPHVAEALVREELVYSYDEAFTEYIGYGKLAYVPKYRISPQEAIHLIVLVGGVAVLAHPGTLGRDELIPSMVKAGLQGIEAIHPVHTRELTAYYLRLAQKHGIVPTGGSDYHGEGRGRQILAEPPVAGSVLEDLRARATQCRRGCPGPRP